MDPEGGVTVWAEEGGRQGREGAKARKRREVRQKVNENERDPRRYISWRVETNDDVEFEDSASTFTGKESKRRERDRGEEGSQDHRRPKSLPFFSFPLASSSKIEPGEGR